MGGTCPVDVLCAYSASGEIRPLRFRMEDEIHQLSIDYCDSLTAVYIEKEEHPQVLQMQEELVDTGRWCRALRPYRTE